ncbi:hypothetical protein G3436_25810 [Pseudomonas sp. MAFF212427]|uniref:Uncharacterized protein n=1 Tax=Pseudomonas brassicae TaxID=2708063 RepID=A0A6B3P443_9PSED|nr:hypothetical protein [Pseudomonas brassicae]NER66647.1 hypothetical protein [Pseudomonas brassicae]
MAMVLGFLSVRFLPLALSVMGWLLLAFAAQGVSENAIDSSDTRGLPPLVIYVVGLCVLGGVSIVCVSLYALLHRWVAAVRGVPCNVMLYALLNIPLLLAGLGGGLAAWAYAADSVLGLMSASAYGLSLISMLCAGRCWMRTDRHGAG